MNRKLHNTLIALIASSGLLTLGLIAGNPVMPSLHDAVAPSSIATLDQIPALPEVAIQAGEAAPATSRRTGQAPRSRRQSVSMPFFSFAPRG